MFLPEIMSLSCAFKVELGKLAELPQNSFVQIVGTAFWVRLVLIKCELLCLCAYNVYRKVVENLNNFLIVCWLCAAIIFKGRYHFLLVGLAQWTY